MSFTDLGCHCLTENYLKFVKNEASKRDPERLMKETYQRMKAEEEVEDMPEVKHRKILGGNIDGD